MFSEFFFTLRQAKLPVSLSEYLMLLEALQQQTITSTEQFYFLARGLLVKNEQHFDRFDRVFAHCMNGQSLDLTDLHQALPESWLRKQIELHLSPEEKAKIEAMGGWQALMETLAKRLQEQDSRHQGGNRWIGTGGRSPFGAFGFNPMGIRIGQGESRHQRAVKVWDQRHFRTLDDEQSLESRNMQMALRGLRQFARQGGELQLDLTNTIRATASNGGLLSLKMRPERRNITRVVLLLDIGGSMDEHVHTAQALFSAARSEFRQISHYYFHNCPYEQLWCDENRQKTVATESLAQIHSEDSHLIVVGDATMSPYEIVQPGGSVEHMNQESGEVWLKRLLGYFPKAVWLNPQPKDYWPHIHSLQMIEQLLSQRMFALTPAGIAQAIRCLQTRR